MLTAEQAQAARERAAAMLDRCGIALTPAERERIEVADAGFGRLEEIGLQVVTYVNTERCCAKELVLFPRQTFPEHRHPPHDGEPGKEETFRCRWGTVYLYVPGDPAAQPQSQPPADRRRWHTVWHEVVLRPGEQYTLLPDTLHWFQAGDEGAVVSEFSTRSTDELDAFTDPAVRRIPVITPVE
jgi:D-lyxose ketol-isomerase